MAGRKSKHGSEALEVVSPDPRKHIEGMLDLTVKAFGSPGTYYESVRRSRSDLLTNEGEPYDWDASAVGLIGGQVVTHWAVMGYNMRIGRARVRVAGIGGVATHGDYRRRGLMAKTATASINRLRDHGYDLSVLFGIGDFYHRFGYVRAWSDTDWTVATGDLPAEKPDANVRKFAVRYREDLDSLYNRTHANLTGTAVRPVYKTKRVRRKHLGYLWRDRRGRAAGYVIVSHSPGELECSEFAGRTEQVLRVLGMLCRKLHCGKLRFEVLHYDSDLCRRLRRGSCQSETHYIRCGGAMVRTVNLAATLQKMRRELSRRLKDSHLSAWRGRLLIADKRRKAMLKISRSNVDLVDTAGCRHAIRGGNEIAQLLIGTHDPMETVRSSGIKLTGEARSLVQVLFPAQHPTLSPRDRF